MCPRVQHLVPPGAPRVARALGVLGVVWIIALLAASVARADPVAACTSAGAVADCSSWFRADVVVSWSAPDAELPGCPDELVPAPPAGATSTIRAAGCMTNDGTTFAGPEIKFDRAPPGVT